MGRNRRTFSAEFKQKVIQAVLAGQSQALVVRTNVSKTRSGLAQRDRIEALASPIPRGCCWQIIYTLRRGNRVVNHTRVLKLMRQVGVAGVAIPLPIGPA